MKNSITIKSLLAVCFVLLSLPMYSQTRLTVITFNIKSFEGSSGDMSKAFIIKPYADLLSQYKPDIICLNEVENLTSRMMVDGKYRDVVQELASLMGMYGLFGYSYAMENKDGSNKDESKYTFWEKEMYGNAILSKYPILNSSSFLLPRPAGSADQRSVLTADIILPDAKIIRAAATHLDHVAGQLEQSQLLVSDKVISGSLPTILAGDLNVWSGHPAIQKVTEQFEPLDNFQGGIDYILGYPKGFWKVVNTRIVPSMGLSDHNAVMSVIEYTN